MDLFERPMSSIPVSIGTSLALESIFIGTQKPYDDVRKIPQRINLQKYQECHINVETLIRNIATCVDKVAYLGSTPGHVLEILQAEIEIIRSVFMQEGHGICLPVFFHCSYKSIASEWKNKVSFRQANTDLQKSFALKEEQVVKKLLHTDKTILELDSDIRPLQRDSSALIITHYAYDLVSYKHFRKLDLLESHTGILKTKDQWNTKYAPMGKETLTHLPFLKDLLAVFGDKNQIEPQRFKTRLAVHEISIKEKWTPYSTLEKVRQGYRNSNMHPADIQLLLSL